MRRIAIINQKGGVGKTTTSANLGAALALEGRRVVVVDMDAQAHLSLCLNVEARSESPSTYTVLTSQSKIEESLRPTSIPNLRILASNIDLSGAEIELASAFGREYLMRDAITEWVDAHRARTGIAPADYLIFDCPPSLGLLSINALSASREVIIALQTEFLALQGMSKLVEIFHVLKKRMNPELEILGILPCLYDSRLKLAREVLGEIRSFFPGQVFKNPIRSNVKLAEAPSFGKTIFEYAPDSNGAQDYLLLVSELIATETRDPELAGLPPFRLDVTVPRAEADAVQPSPARAEAREPAADPVRAEIPTVQQPKQVAPVDERMPVTLDEPLQAITDEPMPAALDEPIAATVDEPITRTPAQDIDESIAATLVQAVDSTAERDGVGARTPSDAVELASRAPVQDAPAADEVAAPRESLAVVVLYPPAPPLRELAEPRADDAIERTPESASLVDTRVLARDEASSVDEVSSVMGLARNLATSELDSSCALTDGSANGGSPTVGVATGVSPIVGAATSGVAVLERTSTDLAARTEIALAELSDAELEPMRAARSAESDATSVDAASAWDDACACDLPPLPDDAIELPSDFQLP